MNDERIGADGHTLRLIFEDEYGDFARCPCGEQGFDFKQGREWFAEHLSQLDKGERNVTARNPMNADYASDRHREPPAASWPSPDDAGAGAFDEADVRTVIECSSPYRNCQNASAFRAACPEVDPGRPESWCRFCAAHARLRHLSENR